MYENKYNDIPSEPGVRFFAALISRGVFENTKNSARKLTCPGIKPSALGLPDDPTEWYVDLDLVHANSSAYAGRDTKNHPLRKWRRGDEPLVADDNDGGMNHMTTTNVLFGDGSVEGYELFELREKGSLSVDEEVVRVGLDSPVDELRKLSLD